MTNCGLMSNKIFFKEDLGDEVYKVSKEKSAKISSEISGSEVQKPTNNLKGTIVRPRSGVNILQNSQVGKSLILLLMKMKLNLYLMRK